MVTRTGTSNYTIHVPPELEMCWCGSYHDDEYGIQDSYRHHCDHNEPLWNIGHGSLVCPLCGGSFRFEPEMEG